MESNILKNREIIRSKIVTLTGGMSEERLLMIPETLNNNMLWNLGHIIRSTDFLILKLAGEKMNFPEKLDSYFAKGSSPKDWPSTTGLKDSVFEAEKLCRESLDKFLTADKIKSKLKEPYTTSMGMQLVTVSDAVEYTILHEIMHLGQLQIYAKLTEGK